jgi:hypothetical protein
MHPTFAELFVKSPIKPIEVTEFRLTDQYKDKSVLILTISRRQQAAYRLKFPGAQVCVAGDLDAIRGAAPDVIVTVDAEYMPFKFLLTTVLALCANKDRVWYNVTPPRFLQVKLANQDADADQVRPVAAVAAAAAAGVAEAKPAEGST